MDLKKLADAIRGHGLERREGDTVTNEDGVATWRRADGEPFMWMPWGDWEALKARLKEAFEKGTNLP